ncbi:hypothetical protein ACFQ10_21065 [Streptomyces indonesiensis]
MRQKTLAAASSSCWIRRSPRACLRRGFAVSSGWSALLSLTCFPRLSVFD